MSEKRKDSKGRVLKDGESQRANGTYDYRYTDIHKKRRCINCPMRKAGSCFCMTAVSSKTP